MTAEDSTARPGVRTGTAPDPQDDPAHQEAQARRLAEAWRTPTGWRYFTAVNNSEVGKWYVTASFFFFLCAGLMAIAMRAQLWAPGNDLVSPSFYNQLLTLHGSVMMFLFAVPMLEAVAILMLPQMLAARDLPFPRLSAFGFWCFLIGGVFVTGSILFSAAPQGGWFMYPPLTTDTRQSGIGADIWLLGLSFIEIASIAAAVELIVGVLKCRPPGMRIDLMPLYAWYVLVVGGMILFAFPPLIIGDMLFELQRALDWPFFDASRGGDPLLWQHLFWIFGHPEVYIVFLPSVALAAMIVPTFARVPVFGYTWIVLAAVGTGFLSFGLWAHHMFTTGLPVISLGLFSAASAAVAIPTGIQLFALIATVLIAPRPVMSTPMLFLAGALAIFVLGGLTGVMVAMAAFDMQVHDTHFIVAHLHHTLIGGMVFPVFAGIYYYYPFVFERRLSDRLGRWASWLMFLGFVIAFVPMHFTGLRGMPRRVVTYPDEIGWTILNQVSTVGAFLLAAGVLVVVYDVLRSKRREPVSERNPWNAGTLEWVRDVPGRPWGVRSVPVVNSRYPLWDDPAIVRRIDEGRYFLPDAEEGRRETLVTSVVDARPLQVQRLPGPSWITLIAAGLTGAVFILPTFKLYWQAVVCAALALAAILFWLWNGTGRRPEKAEKNAGLGLALPLSMHGPSSSGWWAMLITLIADTSAYVSLVFAYFYYWTVNAVYPPPSAAPLDGSPLMTAAVAVAVAWLLTLVSRLANERAASPYLVAALLVLAALSAAVAIHQLISAPLAAGLDPKVHAYQAVVWVTMIWLVLHLGIGIVMHLYVACRALVGHLTHDHAVDIWNISLFWHFAAATALSAVAILWFGQRGLS